MPMIPPVAPLSSFSESYATWMPNMPKPRFAPMTHPTFEVVPLIPENLYQRLLTDRYGSMLSPGVGTLTDTPAPAVIRGMAESVLAAACRSSAPRLARPPRRPDPARSLHASCDSSARVGGGAGLPGPAMPRAYGRKGPRRSQWCVVSMHPHGADRHTPDVPEARTDPGVEDAAEPQVHAQPEGELEIGAAVAGQEEAGRLHVRNERDGRALRRHPAAERQPHRDDQDRAAADEVRPDAEDQRAVEGEIRRLGDDALARFHPEQQHALPGPGRIEEAAPEPDIELAARHPVDALERG